MSSNSETIVNLTKQNWHKPIGLILLIAAVIVFDISLIKILNVPGFISIIILLVTCAFASIYWFFDNRVPKTRKGKVGFVVCIQFSDEEEKKIIREDFITTLRNLLKGGPLGKTFHFIEIPPYISEGINDLEDAYALMAKTKSHFFIFGRVRLRQVEGNECHILELNGIVSHRPLAKEVSTQLSSEFSELFPQRLHIQTENGLLTLQFTSDWTECVAKYIIGIAAYCSFDINYAEVLYTDVDNKLKNIQTNFPIFEKLKQRLPVRFSEIYMTRARAFINEYRKTKEKDNLAKCISNLEKISPALHDYGFLTLRSLEAFLNGRRIKEAIDFAKKSKQIDDPVWHLNLAFLYAYNGNLQKSIQQYRLSADYNIQANTISEIEDFIVWILEEEPEKYQLYYCLGFFNWKIKGDLIQSTRDFEEFISKAGNEFAKEKELALRWVSEIKDEKQLN